MTWFQRKKKNKENEVEVEPAQTRQPWQFLLG